MQTMSATAGGHFDSNSLYRMGGEGRGGEEGRGREERRGGGRGGEGRGGRENRGQEGTRQDGRKLLHQSFME